MFDGITGLVTQPIDGAKKEGIAGLIKGLGKGIGGVVLKPQAGKLTFIACQYHTNLRSGFWCSWLYPERHLQRNTKAFRF